MDIYHNETRKPLAAFVRDLRHAGERRGFLIHNENSMEMAHTFGTHGLEVAKGFDLHMIQICKPEKAAVSLGKNVERAPLMPKFIMTFTANDATQVRLLRYRPETVAALLPDPDFAQSLTESYGAITAIIEEAL
jgi:hypothetical protein